MDDGDVFGPSTNWKPRSNKIGFMEPTTTGKGTLYNSPATREGTHTTGQHKWLAKVENAKSTTVWGR